MQAIEPNWVSLLWFAAFATVGTLAFLDGRRHVSAALAPGRGEIERGDAAGGRQRRSAGSAFGRHRALRLRRTQWSTLVVVTGLVVLFAPGLFEVWPASLRDGRTGLVVLVGVQMLALAALAKVAGPSWRNLS